MDLSDGWRAAAATDPAQLPNPRFDDIGKAGIGSNLALHITAPFNASGNLIEGLVDILWRVTKCLLGKRDEVGVDSIWINLSLGDCEDPLTVKGDREIGRQDQPVSP